MWPRRSHRLAFLTEAAIIPKGRKILCNGAIEESFKEFNNIVCAKALLNYPYCNIPFTVDIDASDKQLCAIIGHNNKNY